MHIVFTEAVYNLHVQQSVSSSSEIDRWSLLLKEVIIKRKVALYLNLVKAYHNTTFCSTRNISDLVYHHKQNKYISKTYV